MFFNIYYMRFITSYEPIRASNVTKILFLNKQQCKRHNSRPLPHRSISGRSICWLVLSTTIYVKPINFSFVLCKTETISLIEFVLFLLLWKIGCIQCGASVRKCITLPQLTRLVYIYPWLFVSYLNKDIHFDWTCSASRKLGCAVKIFWL